MIIIYKTDKERLVVESLIKRELLSQFGDFEITEHLLIAYCETYRTLFGKTDYVPKKTQSSYAKKLASLTLLNLKQQRSIIVNEAVQKVSKMKIRNGFLYLISNPAFPGYIKVGITKNLNQRLASYQTYDPFRRFKVEHYAFCEDIRKEEIRIINMFSVDVKTGEWVKTERALDIYKSIKSMTKD